MTRHKKQPTAEMYREQLALAADRIIELESSWWRRLCRRVARLLETDKQTAAMAALERV